MQFLRDLESSVLKIFMNLGDLLRIEEELGVWIRISFGEIFGCI